MSNNTSDYSEESVSDPEIVSFVVRLWREEPSSEAKEAIWRGHISAVAGGTRHYFTDVNEIPDLIRDYLKSAR